MSYHAWLLMVKKARRTFYLKKIALLFGLHIVWLIEQDQESALDYYLERFEAKPDFPHHLQKSLELEVSA
jgi:phage repressor protein C with HTH and peptisase S24 domain